MGAGQEGAFMDRGRQMPNGIPPLKERRYVREDESKREVWVSLVSQGWKRNGTPLGCFCGFRNRVTRNRFASPVSS